MKIAVPRIIHPFLFGLFPILFLFAHNIDEVPVIDILLPIVAVTLGTSVVFLCLKVITRDYGKSGLVTSLLLVLFFSYGRVSSNVAPVLGPVKGTIFLGFLWLAVFISGSVLIIRAHTGFSQLHRTLNVVAFTLIGISIINIAIQGLSMSANAGIATATDAPGNGIEKPASRASVQSPDIYYIIVDSYARQSTLKDIFGYDNSEFLGYLADKGFYVADKSRSNYAHTALSISSSLNMEYLDNLITANDMAAGDYSILRKLISNNRLMQFLKANGYYCIYISDGIFSEGIDKYDEVYLPGHGAFGLGMTNFAVALLKTTALEPFRVIWGADIRRNSLYVFDTLSNITEITGPKFVFVHSRGVHTPFVFDSKGDPAIGVEFYAANEAQYYQKGYVEQLIFINKKLRETIDEILLKSRTAPIIVMQSDHGSSATIEVGDTLDEMTEVQLNERMNILNTYFLPDSDYHMLYESITPLNSFRVILNTYFSENLSLLQDESYYSTPEQLYQFVRVTDEDQK